MYSFIKPQFYHLSKNMKKSYKNNEFKISAPTQNQEFELPDGSYSVSYIQDCFEYIIKKHQTVTDDSSIKTQLIQQKTKSDLKLKEHILNF